MKRYQKWLLLLLFLLVSFVFFNYNSGTPVQDLIEKYTYPESEFLNYEGMDVHYRVTGNGPALVLVHGVASSLQTWEGWHSELSNEFTVISFDVPGFGITGPHPDDDYSVNMYMGLINHLLDHLKVDSCFMAGNSFGGFLTWNYALFDSARLKKIILIDASGYNANREIKNPGFKLAMNPWTRKITHRITPYFLVKKSVEDVYGDKSLVSDETVQRYFDLMLREGNREAFSKILIQLHSGESDSDQINGITQNSLIMWGAEDRLIDSVDAIKFKDSISNSKLILYEGVGHIPMEEIPVLTARDARKFLLDK